MNPIHEEVFQPIQTLLHLIILTRLAFSPFKLFVLAIIFWLSIVIIQLSAVLEQEETKGRCLLRRRRPKWFYGSDL